MRIEIRRLRSAAALVAFLCASRLEAEVLAPQPGCSQREFVYLGGRLLAVADAQPPGVSVGFPAGGATVAENGVVNVPFVLTTPSALGCRVYFEYAVTPGSAEANADYVPPPTPWADAFPPNTASGIAVNVPITVLPDTLHEAAETFTVEITAVAGGVVGPTATYVVTIANDDPPPQVSVADASAVEGNAGSTSAAFTVSLSSASGLAAAVPYATADGTARAPADYQAAGGVLTFEPGQTQRTVAVLLAGDSVYEPDETFVLNLSNPTGATIADGQGVGTIVNDDPPGLSVSDARVAEGDSGDAAFTFTVSLEAAAPGTVTAQWSTTACTATPPDFTPASGTVTFAAGSTVPQTFTVYAQGDLAPEGHELFGVGLSSPVNASLKDPSGHGSIENDDAPAPAASLPTADFNGDGNPDLLWFNTTSGNLVTWQMVGANRLTGAFLNPPAIGHINWQVVGTANFDSDPQPDILWRNETSGRLVAWFMNGLNRTDGVFLNPDQEADLAWQVVGTGPFGGTPQPDILWRNDQTGALRVWFMNGVNRDAVVDIPGPADLRWKVIGTGDIDRDGDADLWWRRDEDGALAVWRMNGTTLVQGLTPSPAAMPDFNWVAAGTPDLDRDGDPDLLWRHAVSGNLVVWLMDGVNRVCGVYLNPPQVIDANWKVVGPR